MTKPISPSEVGAEKQKVFPPEVFSAFNIEIAGQFDGRRAVIRQKDIVRRLTQGGLDPDDIFQKGWLNVEDAYSVVGWDVKYDRPAYNETGEATFTFTPKR